MPSDAVTVVNDRISDLKARVSAGKIESYNRSERTFLRLGGLSVGYETMQGYAGYVVSKESDGPFLQTVAERLTLDAAVKLLKKYAVSVAILVEVSE